ncbi:MAG: Pr6Pr family membrane protein [Bacteroidetes bacterium]|nr:Pr6Pr family membrane protein [Bacteroidota bacterium]
MKNKYKWLIAIVGWFGLALQLYLLLSISNNKSAVEKLINYFSYFTILTNLLVAFGITISLTKPNSNLGKFFSKSGTESALTVYILGVGVIYFFLLRNLYDLNGWNLVADTVLHTIIPFLFLLYWIFFVPKGQLYWKNGFRWLLYPFVYLVYVLIRGFIDCFYPYPFANVNKLGYGKALTNGFWILIFFLVLGLILIAIDSAIKEFGQRKKAVPTK